MNRRQVTTAAVGIAAGLSGCSGFQSPDETVDLTVINQTTVPYTLEIGFFGDGDSEAAARAYDATLDIDAEGRETRAVAVEPGRYLVRYEAFEDNSRLTDEDHVHFILSGDGTAELTFDIQETGELTRR